MQERDQILAPARRDAPAQMQLNHPVTLLGAAGTGGPENRYQRSLCHRPVWRECET